jgi:hypothetical protein
MEMDGRPLKVSARSVPGVVRGDALSAVDHQRLRAEGVGETDAQLAAADGEADDLAQGCVLQVSRGEQIARFGDLLRGAPAGDPMVRRGGACGLCQRERA